MPTEEQILEIKSHLEKLDFLDDLPEDLLNEFSSTINAPKELIIKEASKRSFFIFCKYILNIRDKANSLIAFTLQQTQLNVSKELLDQYLSDEKNRIAILKGRQAGLSTLIPAYAFWLYYNGISIKYLLIGLNDDSNTGLFKTKIRDLFHNMNESFKPLFLSGDAPIKENEHEFVLNQNLSFYAKSHSSRDSGRSGTFNFIHFTECGYYSLRHVEGAINAISSSKNTFIIAETTANGMNNLIYDIYTQVRNSIGMWRFYFDGWWNVPDYKLDNDNEISEFSIGYRTHYNPSLTDSQLRWLDSKFFDVGRIEERLHCEFPPSPEIAFKSSSNLSILNIDKVARAFTNQNPFTPEYIPIVMGIDIGFNNDKTVIALKRGNYIEVYDDFVGVETGNIVNKIYQAIIDLAKYYTIAHVNIDSVGVGRGVFDDLKRMVVNFSKSIKINMINGGSSVDNPKYPSKNLNAYLIYKFQEWLDNPETKIKDHPQLAYEISMIKTEFRENGILHRIDKEEARKQGGKSPDFADALLYTFAYEVPDHLFNPIERDRRALMNQNNPQKKWDSGSVFDGRW